MSYHLLTYSFKYANCEHSRFKTIGISGNPVDWYLSNKEHISGLAIVLLMQITEIEYSELNQ